MLRFHTDAAGAVTKCEGTDCPRCNPVVSRLLPYDTAVDAAHTEAARRDNPGQIVADVTTSPLWLQEQRPRGIPMPDVVRITRLDRAMPGATVSISDGGRTRRLAVDGPMGEGKYLPRGSNREATWGKQWSGNVIFTTATPSHRLVPDGLHAAMTSIMASPQEEASVADSDEARRAILGRARQLAESRRRR